MERAVRIRHSFSGSIGGFAPRQIRYGLMSAWAVAAAHLVIVAHLAGSGLDTKTLVASLAAAEVPVVIGAALAAAGCTRWRARHEAALRDQRRLAARADLAERALAHTQERAHELRATLGGLLLSNELLVGRREAVSREARRRLQSLHTTELARVQRLLAARPAGAATSVDLARVLDPLVDVMALQGCAVRWRGTEPYVRGRADDLIEVAHILLDNAARHAAGRGVVLDVTTCDGWVEVRVQDGGPGVPRALTPVVFDRGTRGADSHGEGIGLHVARRLAQELGGDLWLRPQHPACGAEFVLRLPEAKGQAPCLAAAV